MKREAAWLLVLSLAATSATAQDEPDFELDEAPRWTPFGELLLRGDRVTGLPNGRDDLERVRGRFVAGLRWQGDAVAFAVAGRALAGSDDNRDNLANNDVGRSDDVGLDQFWFRWQGGERASVQAGKAALPFELSPMLWDDELRPVGASARFTAGDALRWQLDVAGVEPDPLGERSATLAGAQFGLHWREGAPWSAGLLLGYFEWSDLAGYARAGLGRGNTLAAGRYVHHYRLVDLQIYLRARAFDEPLEARLDRVHNLDPGRDDDGTRASLVLGDRFDGGWEFGWSWQRIQRDAVLAAVNADDWWFHAAARGHMPWVGYGFDATWSVRAAAFLETRDGLDERTERLLLDVAARW